MNTNEFHYQLLMQAIKIDQRQIGTEINRQTKEIADIIRYYQKEGSTRNTNINSSSDEEIYNDMLVDEAEEWYAEICSQLEAIETIKCLTLTNIDPNVLGNNGTNSLQYIVIELIKNRNTSNHILLETLLKYGADPSQKCLYNDEYIPILHQYLTIYDQIINTLAPGDSFQLLLNHASDVNVTDNWGRNIGHIIFDIFNNKDMSIRTINNLVKTVDLNIDQKAIIADQYKVVAAKIKNSLPKSYGKSVRELITANIHYE